MNPQVLKANNGKTIPLSKCAMCGSKKPGYNKKKEANGILSSLGLKTPLSKIPLFGNILFWMILNKMNEIVSKFLLAWDKCMPEKHLKEPGFTYSVCVPFTKNKERIKKFKETGNSRYVQKWIR